MLGEVRAGPSKGKGLQLGIADDILGKKSATTLKQSTTVSLKPIGKELPKMSERPLSLSQTQPIPKKTVRMADPLETSLESNEMALNSSNTKQETRRDEIEERNIETTIQTKKEESNNLGDERIDFTQKEIVAPSDVLTERLDDRNLEPEKNVSPTSSPETPHPQVELHTQEEFEKTIEAEKPFSSELISTATKPLEDLTELTSQRAREALIKQQYNTLSIQRVYSQIIDRSSIQYPLHVAILKGDDKLVEQMLSFGENGTILIEKLNQLNYCDRHCRKAIHYAAFGRNPRIIDIIFLTSRLYYENMKAIELTKLKEERKKCLNELKTVFHREILAEKDQYRSDEVTGSDYRISTVEKWYKNELFRISRQTEFQVESAWIRAISERDSRGMTPLHYCVCSPDYLKNKIVSQSILEALISPIRGGRGQFMLRKDRESKLRDSSISSKRGRLEERVANSLADPIWFQADSMYNSITGQEIFGIVESNLVTSAAEPKLSTYRTTKKKSMTLPNLTLGNSVSFVDPNIDNISNTEKDKSSVPSVDYEVIIPWLLRNIFKRAQSMGKSLGSGAIDILEELVEMIDPYSKRTLIVPEIKDLLGYLGIMVTGDVIKELCYMYPGSFEIVQEKWSLVNQDEIFTRTEDDDGEEEQTGSKIKGETKGSKYQKKMAKGVQKGSKDRKDPSNKKSDKSTDLDIYENVEVDEPDSKIPLKSRKSIAIKEDESYGLDFNKLIDDLSTGKGMKSITSFQGKNLFHSRTYDENNPLPSQQDDILNEFQDINDDSGNALTASDLTLDLPQTLSVQTISKYRKYVINLTDENQSTPLLLATALNKREIVEILLSYGGDITIPSKDGQTPFTVVSDHSILSALQKKMMKLLKSNSIQKGFGQSNSLSRGVLNVLDQSTVIGLGLTTTQSALETQDSDSRQLISKSCGNNSDGLLLQLHQLHTQRWNYSQTALTWAVGSGMNEIIEKLLELGANVTETDAMGRTPLHHCIALAGQITIDSCQDLEESISRIFKLRSIADTLLDKGANLDARTSSGRTPLHEMFCRGQEVNSSKIMKKNQKFKTEASYLALIRAKSLIVRSLIQRGGDPHATDRQGYCPLHYCARENMTSCLVEMLNAADVNILFPCPRGRTVLHIACLYGCEETAEIICKWDADEKNSILLAKDSSGKIPRDLMAKDMNPLSLTTIWNVCRSGNSLRLNEILAKTRDLTCWTNVDQSQNDALSSSILQGTFPLKTGANSQFQELWLLDGVDAKSRRKRLSPLHCTVLGWVEVSARAGNVCAKRALGETKRSTSKLSNHKSTNLSHATILSILLQNFAFVDNTDHRGRTPLMFAAASNLTDCIQLLCAAGCDVNRSDNQGNTALHYAYATGSIAAISLLEEKGADSSKENLKERTPLSIAGLFQSIESINS